VLDAATGRAVDFIACFVDPERVPSVRAPWMRLQAHRRLAYEHPYGEAVLALLETDAYRKLRRHEIGWIAERLGITVAEEEATIDALRQARLVERSKGAWKVPPNRHVDTRHDAEAFHRLKCFWSAQAAERLNRNTGSLCAYSVFSVPKQNLEQILRLYEEAFESSRGVMREATGAERVVLATIQVTSLDGQPVRPPGSLP
jgi:DNA-binding MarR family transcriptional regulator